MYVNSNNNVVFRGEDFPFNQQKDFSFVCKNPKSCDEHGGHERLNLYKSKKKNHRRWWWVKKDTKQQKQEKNMSK